MPQVQLLNSLARELSIFFAFTWRDWSTTIISGSIFSIGAMRKTHPSMASTFPNITFLIVWLSMYIYFFNLSNQISGVEEDRINKPSRPIPSGKVALSGAKLRWAFVFAAFLSLAAYRPAVLPETICWVISTAILCATPVGGHWFFKNCVLMTTGTWAQLGASWKAIAPSVLCPERYVYAISLWIGVIISIQDLRDMKGDAAIGRRTLPLVYGNTESRRIIAYLAIPVSLVVLKVGCVLSLAPLSIVALHGLLGYRVLQDNGSVYDHKTYMMFTYVYCFLLALVAFEGADQRGLFLDVIQQIRI